MKKLITPANLFALLAVALVVTGFSLCNVALGLIILGLFCGIISWCLTPNISARKASPSDASEPEPPARRYWHDCRYCDSDRDTCDVLGTGDDCANCKAWWPLPPNMPRTNGYRTDCIAFRAETEDCSTGHGPGRCLDCSIFGKACEKICFVPEQHPRATNQ
jgi:hypothetical protein